MTQTDQDTEPFETNYEGLFGKLCKHIPLFDAKAPRDWIIAYRSYRLTAWHNPVMEATIICEKSSDGWNVYIRDHRTGGRHQVLPKNTYRWKAFDAVRAFFAGEPLMKADSTEGGLFTEEDFRNA